MQADIKAQLLYSPTSTSMLVGHTDDYSIFIPTITTDIANIVGNKLNSDVAYMTATANKYLQQKHM